MKEHQCEYYGGICLCGKRQPVIRPERIKPKRKKITSEFQYYTDMLITYLGVPVKEFPRFARYVKLLGCKRVPEIIGKIKETEDWCWREHHSQLNKIGYFINHFCKRK